MGGVCSGGSAVVSCFVIVPFGFSLAGGIRILPDLDVIIVSRAQYFLYLLLDRRKHNAIDPSV